MNYRYYVGFITTGLGYPTAPQSSSGRLQLKVIQVYNVGLNLEKGSLKSPKKFFFLKIFMGRGSGYGSAKIYADPQIMNADPQIRNADPQPCCDPFYCRHACCDMRAVYS